MATKRSILDHVLVPKCRILSKKEVEELLKKYGVSLENLPRILADDPMVKAIGAKRGDVIEIIRNSPIAGESVYYRVVI